MRQTSFLIVLLIIISCSKHNNIKIDDLSGLYQDSLTYTRNQYSPIKDTVIQKRIYKINDSTYKMGALYNVDSSFVVNPIMYWPITFVHRPDNTIITKPEYQIALPYLPSFYDPSRQTIINLSRIDHIFGSYEIHNLKRIDQ
jgi:hypothetical protein